MQTCEHKKIIRGSGNFLAAHCVPCSVTWMGQWTQPVQRRNPAKGENNGRAKLTREKILAIREDPRSQRVIALDHEICQTNVGLIKRRKLWGHII